MSFLQPLTSQEHWLKNIRLVATDMDGTLTHQGKFQPGLLQALADLAALNIQVLIVTGRSAGWVSGLTHYLPIAGAIAENGGVFYPQDSDNPILLTPIPNPVLHRQQLATTFQQLQQHFPNLQESSDNPFRLTDWTFDVTGLSLEELQQLHKLCQELGWDFTYSTVQCHIRPHGQDKAQGLLKILANHFPQYSQNQMITIGDSPNDESLFNPQFFPYSIGVANVLDYINQLFYKPAYQTHHAEGQGFCELAQLLQQSVQ